MERSVREAGRPARTVACQRWRSLGACFHDPATRSGAETTNRRAEPRLISRFVPFCHIRGILRSEALVERDVISRGYF
jgi:hypothetical protein